MSSTSAKPLLDKWDSKASPRAALDPLFLPRSVAVIGATDRPGTVGRSLLSNLLENRSAIKIFAVTPNRVDLALVVTPAQTVPQIISDCVDAGVRSAVVISAGFREQGPQGALLEQEIQKHLRRGSLRLM